MKNTTELEGRKLYGPRFQNYDRLVIKHFRAATHPRCDQGHYSAAFLTFHRAFTLLFEESLLAVAPEVLALPYWDYDADLRRFPHLKASDIFSPDAFGTAAPSAERGYAVTDGLFANFPVARTADLPSEFGFDAWTPLGTLRGVTNWQDGPSITRWGEICGEDVGDTVSPAEWETCLNTTSTFLRMFDCIDAGMQGLHSFAHRWLGGAWGTVAGCDAKQDGPTIADVLSGCLACDRGSWTCARNETRCAEVDASEKCMRYPGGDGHPYVLDDGSLAPCQHCGDACESDGGHLGAAGDFWDGCTSPNDPIFWLHHANVDRFFATWQVRVGASLGNYSGFPTEGLCPGHNLHDVISELDPFPPSLVRASGSAPLTNAQLLEATDPRDAASYVYDTLL